MQTSEQPLAGLRILLGVSGSIAAYKTPQMVRDLQRAGAEIRVAMTDSAEQFVAPLALVNVSRHDVALDMFALDAQSGGSWHIHLAHWCDLMLIAPCSATTLARIAGGFADNAVSALALALPEKRPLLLAPAMDTDMWQARATQRNVKLLSDDGVKFIGPEGGELASGLSGPGRLAELEKIISALKHLKPVAPREVNQPQTPAPAPSEPQAARPERDIVAEALARPTFPLEDAAAADRMTAELEFEKMKKAGGVPPVAQTESLRGVNIVISAGPTREKIDDVRYLTNHSSGKMGYALAAVAAARGATVTLVSGPTNLETPDKVRRVDVESAADMFKAVMAEHGHADVCIMSAAVADFTPQQQSDGKIKKTDIAGNLNLELTRTQDILAALGQHKRDKQLVIGFALEAKDALANAQSKLERKNADMIVLNELNKSQSGFGGDDNTITLIRKGKDPQSFPPASKVECAGVILDAVAEMRA